jgi:hypothetical protein
MDVFPTAAEVDRIAACGDAVVRNLQITQCYHELAAAVATRAGPDANWCAFATWASKQAGQTIRQQDLAQALQHLLAAPEAEQAAARVLVAAGGREGLRDAGDVRLKMWEALEPATAFDRAGGAVARGNQKVFAEIGREFARFAAACLGDPACDAGRIDRFCAGLRSGEPPDGQRYLRQAFARYYQAFFERDPKARAELVLLANLEIGLHEQTRLQPEIAAALNAALVDPRRVARRLLAALFPLRGWPMAAWMWLRRRLNRPSRLDLAIDQLVAIAQQQLRRLLTEHLMVLCLPRGVRLRLGDDLRAGFPAALKQIDSPDLRALLQHIDSTPDSPVGSGADDWADLPERLHFIADLFRCYQQAPLVWEPPFAPDQVAAIQAGQLPGGQL